MTAIRSVRDRLRSAWSRNDGKAKEHWAPGLDLKELVFTVALVIVVAAMLVGTVALVVQGSR